MPLLPSVASSVLATTSCVWKGRTSIGESGTRKERYTILPGFIVMYEAYTGIISINLYLFAEIHSKDTTCTKCTMEYTTASEKYLDDDICSYCPNVCGQ